MYSCEDWALVYSHEGIHNKTDKIPQKGKQTHKQTNKENNFSVQQSVPKLIKRIRFCTGYNRIHGNIKCNIIMF